MRLKLRHQHVGQSPGTTIDVVMTWRGNLQRMHHIFLREGGVFIAPKSFDVGAGISVWCVWTSFIQIGYRIGTQKMSVRAGLSHVIGSFHKHFHAFFVRKALVGVALSLLEPRTIWRVCEQQSNTVFKLHTRQKAVCL